LVAKKDPYLNKHSEDIPIPNLEVLSLMKSFTSKGFTRETFNWQYHYYYLTNTGIEYLRQYLALPADIVPATLKAAAPRPPSMTFL
jgi:small subunit ribosomal protein S10e